MTVEDGTPASRGFDDTATDILAGTLGSVVAAALVVLYWHAADDGTELSP